MNVEIDIRDFLILALGSNEYLHKDIDKIYKENEFEIYEAYKESNYFDNHMFKIFTAIKEEYMKKIAGIVQYDYKNKTDETIFKLIKKGFKFTYRYFEQNKARGVINIQHFAFSLMKSRGQGNIPELEIFHNECVMLYICTKKGIKYELSGEYGELVARMFQDAMMRYIVDKINYNETNFAEHREEIAQLYEELGIKNKKTQSLEIIFDTIIEKETLVLSDNNPTLFMKTRSEFTFRQGTSKYIGALSGWLKALMLHESDLTTVTEFTKEEVDKVLLTYIIAKEENNFQLKDKRLFIASCFYIFALVKEYKKLKDNYLDELRNNFHYEIKKMMDNLKSREEELNKQKREMVSLEEAWKNQKTELIDEIGKLTKQLAEANRKLSEKESDEKELYALRNYLFAQQQEEEEFSFQEFEEQLFNEQVERLRSLKLGIVGGRVVWQHKLKAVFPHYTYINPDALGKNLSFIDKLDGVVFNTSTNNHTFYEKFMKQMNKNDTALIYLNSNNNIKITVSEIYNAFEKLSVPM